MFVIQQKSKPRSRSTSKIAVESSQSQVDYQMDFRALQNVHSSTSDSCFDSRIELERSQRTKTPGSV